MSHRFLPLLIVTWTCWLSLPENAQARSHSFDSASDPASDFVALDQSQLLAQEEAGSSLLDEPALDTESEDEADTGSSLLDNPEAETPRALMQVGSEGPGVEAVQRKLAELGYFSGSADGVYGAATGEAVQQFQEAEGLAVTGQIDLKTWERIQTSNQSLITDSPASDASDASPSPSPGSETAATPSTGAANAEAGTNSEQPTDANSIQRTADQANWTLKRILLVGGVAVFGLVAIAGMSLSIWRWLMKSSTQSHASNKNPNHDTHDVSVADLAGLDAAAFHAINTTATPIDNGIQSSPTATGFGPSMPSAYAGQTDEASGDGSLYSSPATNPVNPAVPFDSNPEAASNGSAQLQPPNVSPTTRLSKTNLMESLIQDLDSIDPTVRRKAIWQLGQQGTNQAIQPLVNLMIDSDSQQRSLILAALSEIGQRTLNPMHRALAMSLQDENAEVRKNAIRDLTRIYDQVAQLAPLLRHAMEDADPTVRDTAAWALNQLNRQVKQASFQPNSSPAQLNQSPSQPDDIWQDS